VPGLWRKTPHSKQSIYCRDEECIQARASARNRAERERVRARTADWIVGRRRPTVKKRTRKIPALTGDVTQPCRCGLELRAPTGRELLQVIGRHNGVCLVLQRPDHWSVQTMLAQRTRPYRPHRDVADVPPQRDSLARPEQTVRTGP
jgi:hypothetical protein